MKKRSISLDFFVILLSAVIAGIISLLYQIPLARYLGPEDYGRFYLALSICSLFIVLISGFNGTIVVFVSKNRNNPEIIRQIFFIIIFLILPILLFLSFILYSKSDLITKLITKENLNILSFFYIYLIFNGIFLPIMAFLRGLQRIRIFAFFKILNSLIFFFLVISFIYKGFSVNELPKIYGIGFFISSALGFVYIISRILNFDMRFNFSTIFARDFLKFFSFVSVTSISTGLFMHFNYIMVGKLCSLTEVGFYRGAMNIIIPFSLISTSLMSALLPHFSAASMKIVKRDFRISLKYMSILGTLICSFIFVISGPLILSIYSPGFEGSILPLKVLSGGIILSFVLRILGSLLDGRGFPKYTAFSSGISFLFLVIFNLLLTPEYGAFGASLSRIMAMFINLVILFYFSMRIFDFKFLEIMRIKILVFITIAIVSSIIIESLISQVLLRIFILSSLLGIIFYKILDLEDRRFLENLIQNIFEGLKIR